MTLGMLVRKN